MNETFPIIQKAAKVWESAETAAQREVAIRYLQLTDDWLMRYYEQRRRKESGRKLLLLKFFG